MKQFQKIFKFEFGGYLRNKIFVGVTLFLMIVIAIAMFIPNILAAFPTEENGSAAEDLPVMLLGSEDASLSQTVAPWC